MSLSDKSEGEHGFWGDLLALLGALFYGLYCSLMRIKIKDERQISMAQFFGEYNRSQYFVFPLT